MYARITVDYLAEGDSFADGSKRGLEWGDRSMAEGQIITFRLLDDDGEIYYRGEGDNVSLETVFEWAQGDFGCTLLQVRKNGDWRDKMDGVWRDEIA